MDVQLRQLIRLPSIDGIGSECTLRAPESPMIGFYLDSADFHIMGHQFMVIFRHINTYFLISKKFSNISNPSHFILDLLLIFRQKTIVKWLKYPVISMKCINDWNCVQILKEGVNSARILKKIIGSNSNANTQQFYYRK